MSKLAVGDKLKSNYQNYYQDGASEWRRLGALDKVDNIVALCSSITHRRILEIGAGEGSILSRLSTLNFAEQLFGLEISPSGVEAIRAKAIPGLAEVKLFDGYAVPYQDNEFDLAVLTHVIEHVEHPRVLLREAARVARYVLVEVPLEHTVRMRRDYTPDAVGHINFYTPKTIRRLMQTSELRVLKQMTTNVSKATYVFQKGRAGLLDYYVKRCLLQAAPALGTALFVYHEALLCESASRT